MNISNIDPNLLVIAILAGTTLYAAVAGIGRLRMLILSIYVGIVMADQLTDLAEPYLHIIGPENTPLALYALPIVLFGFTLGRQRGHDRGSKTVAMLIGLLTGGLIISAALRLIPTDQANFVTDASFIAMSLAQYHLYLLACLPLAALIGPLFKKKERSHH